MDLAHLPLLEIQRDLYTIPRGMERFRTYLATMTGVYGDDIVLPLMTMNPMAKDHVPAMIASLLAMDAESIAASAVEEASRRIPEPSQRLQVGLVATDDAQGGWTNRTFTEMSLRFDSSRYRRRGFVVVPLWTSESWTPESIRTAVLAAIYRAAHAIRHGDPKTLGEMVDQEGRTASFAGLHEGALDADDIAYSRAVIASHRDSTHMPVQVACLYGDAIAKALGYDPLGLSDHAGYAVARADAALNSTMLI